MSLHPRLTTASRHFTCDSTGGTGSWARVWWAFACTRLLKHLKACAQHYAALKEGCVRRKRNLGGGSPTGRDMKEWTKHKRPHSMYTCRAVVGTTSPSQRTRRSRRRCRRHCHRDCTLRHSWVFLCLPFSDSSPFWGYYSTLSLPLPPLLLFLLASSSMQYVHKVSLTNRISLHYTLALTAKNCFC